MNKWIDKLNSEQKEAVNLLEGPLLIVAGSGTGKTRVITTRISYLLESHPELLGSEILAITFTKKAADEMLDRVMDLTGKTGDLWISTFHAFSLRILRDHLIEIGMSNDFKILDQIESRIFFKKSISKLTLKYYFRNKFDTSFSGEALKFISRLKDEMVGVLEFENFAKGLKDKEEKEKYLELSRIYASYEKAKKHENVLDFGDLIIKNIELFKEKPSILLKYQKQFKYILIDEFQDTNIAQIELVSMLAGGHRNISAVGDDDQAIYRFRGASFASFIKFKEKFPELKTIKLTQNYRSTKNILASAGELIKHNDIDRFDPDKNLWTDNPKGEKVTVFINNDYSTEAENIIRQIKELYKLTKDYNSIAVLYRAHSHKDELVKALKRDNVPFKISGGAELFESSTIKELISYLKAVFNPYDSPNLYNLMLDGIFEIDTDTVMKLNKFAAFNNISLYESLAKINKLDLPEGEKKNLENFRKALKGMIISSRKSSVDNFIYEIAMLRTMLIRGLFASYDSDKEREVKLLGAFFRLARRFAAGSTENGLANFMEYIDAYIETRGSIDLDNADYNKESGVQLMTVHQAKGLEFQNLFVISLVQGRFPTTKRGEAIPFPLELMKENLPKGNFHIEEERRLFYVAMTRAKERLILSTVVKPYHKKSAFLQELGDGVIVVEQNSDLTVKNIISRKIDLHSIIFQKKILNIVDAMKSKAGIKSIEKLKSELNSELELLVLEIASGPKKLTADRVTNALPDEMVFSYTHLDTFINCPLKYKFSYLDYIPRRPRAYLVFGDVIHKVLKEFYELIQKGIPVSESIMLALFDKIWSPLGYQDKSEENLKKSEGMKLLKEFYRKNKEEFRAPLFLEKKFLLKISNHLLKGFIDRIDELPGGKVRIIDYKTGKKAARPSLQLDIYAIACMEELGLDVGELAYYYVIDNELVRVEKSQSDIMKSKDKINDIISKMKTCVFLPKPSKFSCGSCDYQLICPAFK